MKSISFLGSRRGPRPAASQCEASLWDGLARSVTGFCHLCPFFSARHLGQQRQQVGPFDAGDGCRIQKGHLS